MGEIARCSVCSNPAVEDIDAALVAGVTYATIAGDHRVSKSALTRHRANGHITAAVATVATVTPGGIDARLDAILGQLERLVNEAWGTLNGARRSNQGRTVLLAIREVKGLIELRAKLEGLLDERPTTTINLLASSEWVQLRAAMMDALAPYPDARQAVAARLLQLGSGSAP